MEGGRQTETEAETDRQNERTNEQNSKQTVRDGYGREREKQVLLKVKSFQRVS